jgi:hypothetical protein
MKIKVSESTPRQLNYLVANIEDGVPAAEFIALEKLPASDAFWKYNYSTDWAQGGPIIEREKIATDIPAFNDQWGACKKQPPFTSACRMYGPTPLIAAMRCLVTSKLGDTVEIPEELCQQQNN